MTLTYLGFHAIFVLPVLVALALFLPRYDQPRRRRSGVGLAILVAIAYAYTTPWGSFMIGEGVWWYGDGRTLLRALEVPLGEYLFFAFQTLMAGFVLHLLGFDPTYRRGDWRPRLHAGGAIAGLAICAIGLVLFFTWESTYYLGSILAWTGPVLALQWAVGAGYLVRTVRSWGLAALLPSVYLWVTDRIAIYDGIWIISESHTTGATILFGLPIEEALFFFVASLMTVNGLVLFEWVLDWYDRTRRSVYRSWEPHGLLYR